MYKEYLKLRDKNVQVFNSNTVFTDLYVLCLRIELCTPSTAYLLTIHVTKTVLII